MRSAIALMLTWAAAALLVGAAQADVQVRTSPMGGARFIFSDGATADWFPAAMGPQWAYTTWRDAFLVEGEPDGLFGEGLTLRLPVRRTEGKCVDVFAQLAPDPEHPEALHFLYRFSAPERTPINTAYIECPLPARDYAGAELDVIGGTSAHPVLPLEVMENESHLADGMASGLAAAADTPHAVWVELEQPRWCVALDARVWKQSQFALQFCALAAAEGTTLSPDAPADISGTVILNESLDIQASADARTVGPGKLHWDGSDPLMPGLLDERGQAAAWFVVVGPSPEQEPFRLERRRGALQGADDRIAWSDGGGTFALQGTCKVEGSQLLLEQALTAPEGRPRPPTWRGMVLSTECFERCRLTFLSEHEPSIILAPNDLSRVIGRAVARGVAVSAGETELLRLEADKERTWVVSLGKEGFWVVELLLGSPLSNHPYGETWEPYQGTLRCRLGPE